MNQSKCLVNEHYQLAFSWKPAAPNFDDNPSLAKTRLHCLSQRFDKNVELKSKFETVIQDCPSISYSRKIYDDKDKDELKMRWYLPHYETVLPRKPDKVRMVFDCSATFNKQSLDKQFLQGPEFLNSLIVVSIRF